MKKEKLTMILFVALLGFANVLYGQEKLDKFMNETTPEERAQFQTDYMKESLSLNDDQTSRVSSINLKYARKMQEVYNAGGRRFQKLKNMKAVNQEKDTELKGALTADQHKTYQKNKEEMKERMRARAKERRKGD